MSGPKILKLSDPVAVGSETIAELSFREPKFAEYIAIGEPVAQAYRGDGLVFRDVNLAAVESYAKTLIIPTERAITVLPLLSLKDSRALVDTILDFFKDAPTSPSEPKSSPTVLGTTSAPSMG